jgi:hypothetical protein
MSCPNTEATQTASHKNFPKVSQRFQIEHPKREKYLLYWHLIDSESCDAKHDSLG